MNDQEYEYKERDCDEFDVENDQICKDLAFEAKFEGSAYQRLKRHIRGVGYTEESYKSHYACRD